MKTSAIGLRFLRLSTGWALFLLGLGVLMWIHNFPDQIAHRAMFPLFLGLWVALGVFIWDGCKGIGWRLRMLVITVQVIVALLLSALLFQHLIATSA